MKIVKEISSGMTWRVRQDPSNADLWLAQPLKRVLRAGKWKWQAFTKSPYKPYSKDLFTAPEVVEG